MSLRTASTSGRRRSSWLATCADTSSRRRSISMLSQTVNDLVKTPCLLSCPSMHPHDAMEPFHHRLIIVRCRRSRTGERGVGTSSAQTVWSFSISRWRASVGRPWLECRRQRLRPGTRKIQLPHPGLQHQETCLVRSSTAWGALRVGFETLLPRAQIDLVRAGRSGPRSVHARQFLAQ